MRLPLPALLLAAAAACSSVACSSGGSPAGAPSSPPPSVSPLPTIVTSPEPTVTALPSPSATASPSPLLADGRHPAYLTKIDVATRHVTVDVIQFLTGEAAEKAAAEDGQEVTNDYYIRNVNTLLRTFLTKESAKITVNTLAADETGDATKDVTVTLPKLASYDFRDHMFWLTVKGGVVVAIAEQYLP